MWVQVPPGVPGKITMTVKDRRISVCPQCGERDMVNYGKYKEVQKYHCTSCGHTTVFPALIGKGLLELIQIGRKVREEKKENRY